MKFKIFMKRFFRALRKRKIVIILALILGIAVGVALNFKIMPDEYVATSSIYASTSSSYTDVDSEVYMFQTYSDIIMSKKVADKAAELLNDGQMTGMGIKGMISYSNEDKSPVYKIHVRDNDPERAILIANVMAKAAAIELNTLTEGNNVQVLDEAYEYIKVFDGRMVQTRNMILWALAGLLLGIVIVFIWAASSNKVETVSDASLNGEIEILGVIPDFDVH